MSLYLYYFVSYVIITLFSTEINRSNSKQSVKNRLPVSRTDHDRSKDHLDAMLMLAHRIKEAVLLDFVVRAASRTGSKDIKVLAECAETAD